MVRPGKEKRAAAQEDSDDEVGSGQSPASIARDKKAQPALFAAAARRKAAGITKVPKTKNARARNTATSTFDIKAHMMDSPSSSRPFKKKDDDKATFELFKAKYQEGPLAGQDTGKIYAKFKPRFTSNLEAKGIAQEITKTEPKWSKNLKAFLAQVPTLEIAQELHRGLSELPGHDNDLGNFNTDIFEDVEPPTISIFPYMGGTAIHGDTYFFRSDLKDMGFNWERDIDGNSGFNVWMSSTPVDDSKLIPLFEEAGFEAKLFDGAI